MTQNYCISIKIRNDFGNTAILKATRYLHNLEEKAFIQETKSQTQICI